jgi:dynein heavy chain
MCASQVFSLGLNHHNEFISELSTNANKELSIEDALTSIGAVWETVDLDMSDFKVCVCVDRALALACEFR